GRGLSRAARGMFGEESPEGDVLSRWALGRDPRVARALALFRRVGDDLYHFVRIVQTGTYRKARVPHRPDTRGARVFLVGGRWMLEGAGRSLSLAAARRKLGKSGVLVPADRIPGLRRVAPVLGIVGASLLVKKF